MSLFSPEDAALDVAQRAPSGCSRVGIWIRLGTLVGTYRIRGLAPTCIIVKVPMGSRHWMPRRVS